MFCADGSTLKFWVLVPLCRCVLYCLVLEYYFVVSCSTDEQSRIVLVVIWVMFACQACRCGRPGVCVTLS